MTTKKKAQENEWEIISERDIPVRGIQAATRDKAIIKLMCMTCLDWEGLKQIGYRCRKIKLMVE